MDIDRFVADNEAGWQRLDHLLRRAERDTARLSAAELDELVTSYQRVSTHLSLARTALRDPDLVARLSTLTARAAAVVYGSRPPSWGAAARFVTETFPAALWHARAFVAVATLLFVVPATAVGSWLAVSPAALDVAAPEAVREAYVERDFAAYYTSEPSAQFASTVTTNNIRVGILAFAGGVLVCLPTAAVLVANGVAVGGAAGLFAAAGEQPRFWGLILPHGLLELTAVFIAGGAGLRLGWALIDPGDRFRAEALAQEGRRAVVLLIGLVGVFAVAGAIEGFVTGAPLPTAVRVAIGVAAEAVFLAYVITQGRRAAARGRTGALGEDRSSGWVGAAHSRAAALTRR